MRTILYLLPLIIAVGCTTTKATMKPAAKPAARPGPQTYLPPVPPQEKEFDPLTHVIPQDPPTPFKRTLGFNFIGGYAAETNVYRPRFFTNDAGILFIVSALQRSNSVLTVYRVPELGGAAFVIAEIDCWPEEQSWYVATDGSMPATFIYAVNTPCTPVSAARSAVRAALGKGPIVGIRLAKGVKVAKTIEELK